MTIDPSVKKLVDTLNSLPGVTTFSSCQGHENPEIGQVHDDEFYVNFDIAHSGLGWSSFETIVKACNIDDRDLSAGIVPWYDDGVRWELRGSYVEKSDIDIFADLIKELSGERHP